MRLPSGGGHGRAPRAATQLILRRVAAVGPAIHFDRNHSDVIRGQDTSLPERVV
jgi:hypothetical protein